MDNPFTKYLEDVPWDNSLRLSNGKTVHGLEQLPMIIKFSDDEVFYSHVNDQKNDFANWIRDVIGYTGLAEKLLSIKKKEDFLTFMDKAITDIKNDMKNYKPPEPKPEPVPIQVSTPASPSASTTPVSVQTSSPIQQPVPQPVLQSVVAPTLTPTIPTVTPTIVSTVVSAATHVQQDSKPVSVSHSTSPIVSESQLFDSPSHDVPIQNNISVSAPVPIVSVPTPAPIITPTPTPTISAPAPVPVVSIPVSPTVVSPSPVPVAPVASPALAPIPAPVSTPVEAVVPEETFDFEEIFKVLLTELEQEALNWDTQTN